MSIPKPDPAFTTEQLREAGHRFIEAGRAYWEAMHKAGIGGALAWYESENGLVIFTRGEYRQTLLKNIPEVGPVLQLGAARDE